MVHEGKVTDFILQENEKQFLNQSLQHKPNTVNLFRHKHYFRIKIINYDFTVLNHLAILIKYFKLQTLFKINFSKTMNIHKTPRLHDLCIDLVKFMIFFLINPTNLPETQTSIAAVNIYVCKANIFYSIPPKNP